MSAVATLAIAADPYLAAAEAHARSCGWYAADSLLTAEKAALLVTRRAEEPAFKAAVDAALTVERRKAAVELRRLRRENGRLRGRIVGAIAAIRNARNVDKPGHAAVALGNALLALEDSRDDEHTQRREAMRSGRHPAGRALVTLNDFE